MKDFEFNPSYHGLVSIAYCNMTLYSGGSEMQPFEARKHFKQTFQRLNFKWLKGLEHLNSCPDFKWFKTKWWLFVWISNLWASRFQIQF